jgi:hypothetical protein
MLFNKRSENKVIRMARSNPEKLIWVYKRFEDADLDNYCLYRLIPQQQIKNVQKGGWRLFKRPLDNNK